MMISLHHPLDLKLSLDSGQAFRWREIDGWWWGTMGNAAVKMRVFRNKLEIFSDHVDQVQLGTMATNYFSLDEDHSGIIQSFGNDPYLVRIIDQFAGLRILRQDFWECLISFLCSAESSVARIRRMTEDMSRVFGKEVRLDGHTLWTFPEINVLANASEQELRDLGLGFRAPNIVEAAERVVNGDINKAKFQNMTHSEAMGELMKFKGIGPKIASCILLFSIGKDEAFPVDRWVRRSLERVYGLPEKMSHTAIEDWAQNRFGRNAGLAQQFLFHAERDGVN
ncbi:MAG: hypothetical protein FI725_03030 [SAR202 cluster bacterium]|nr:hypothetical protein [SAR202 cluster bacterium]|tara:strand:+ start:2510 stop:3352 length:843 start_codon:yes stop_codon:yes gene_type:complete